MALVVIGCTLLMIYCLGGGKRLGQVFSWMMAVVAVLIAYNLVLERLGIWLGK
jgi:hypothetical protein